MALKSKWSLFLVEAAQEDFERLDPPSQRKVYKKLEALQRNPVGAGRPLRIREGSHQKSRSNIVFTLKHDDQIIEVWAIQQRTRQPTYRSLLARVQKLLP